MAHHYAGVAELADALDLGSSASGVGVQVPPPAPYQSISLMRSWWNWQTRYLEGVVALDRASSSLADRTINLWGCFNDIPGCGSAW